MRSRSVSVTGATGFVGWHVAEEFVRDGWHVRAIVRPGNRKPVPAGVHAVEADLTADALIPACSGSDVVVHAAALIRAGNEATLHAVNVEGTRAAAAAALHVGARFLLVSSQAAGGQGTPEAPRREDDVAAPVNAYGRSKLAAEGVVKDLEGLQWTIVRPSAVYGPRDHGFLPLFRLARRGLFVVPTGGETAFTLIYIVDLVRAMRLAVELDESVGQTLFLGHADPRTGVDVLRAIAKSEGRRFRPHHVPRAVVSALAAVGDLSWRIGIKPLIDSGRLAELHAEGFVCSVERARHLLGFTADTPLEDGVERTARWYREEGWI